MAAEGLATAIAAEAPPRAVLDTNVWLDWLVFDDPSVAALRAARDAREVDIVGFARGRAELADVLARPSTREHALRASARRGAAVRMPDAEALLARYDVLATAAGEAPGCGLQCRDADDQPFLDLAVACGARWLLTKDRALLALAVPARRRYSLAIVPPAAYGARS
jgi:predicted nucleic acid-binding protein